MRKSLAALGLVFFLGLLGLYFANTPRATLSPTIKFVGFLPPDDEGNRETRRAAFTVTNSTPRSIVVGKIQVEVFTNGGWQMHSQYEPGTLIKSNPSPRILLLDPGAGKSLVVDCPKGGGWRIGASYLAENSGIKTLFARIRAVHQRQDRDWGVLWRPGFRSFTTPGSFRSDAIPE